MSTVSNVPSYKAKSLHQFLKSVLEIKSCWTDEEDFDPWFRGQVDARWPLVPKLFRSHSGKGQPSPEINDYFNESEIRAEFRRRGAQLLTGREPQDEFDWYFMMQHFGAPTRLLDWSDGALIALYFAVKSETYEALEYDAAVWMLDPWWLNQKTFNNEQAAIKVKESIDEEEYLPKPYSTRVLSARYPAAIDPPHVAQRLAAQHGHFTIHGTLVNAFDELASDPGSRVRKILIAKSSTPDILKDLETCGIVETTLFPDLQALGFEMSQLWHRLSAE